jgi:hypothetical protein
MAIARLRLPRRLSDEQCVEHARRSLARFDRWRPWIFSIYLIATAAFVALLVLFVVIIDSTGKFGNLPLSWAGFVLGIVLGVGAGQGAVQLVHGLALAIFGLRNEELLVKYHDLARSLSDRGGYVFDDEGD